MIHPALALVLAADRGLIQACMAPDFRRPDPADLWTAGVDLTAAELAAPGPSGGLHRALDRWRPHRPPPACLAFSTRR